MAKKTTSGPRMPTAADIRKKYAGDSLRQKFVKVEGKADLCIIPFEHAGEMQIWHKQASHFIKREKRSYVCSGEGCHHCRKEAPRTQFLMNVYDAKTGERGIWQAPPSAWDMIATALGDERNTCLLGGPSGHRPFTITKTKGKGGFWDYTVDVGSKLVKTPSVTPLDLIEWSEGQRLRSAEESVLGSGGGKDLVKGKAKKGR